MKNILLLTSLIATFATTGAAFATEGSGCHFHGSKPANEATVLNCANQRKVALVGSGKLDKAWKTISHDNLEVIEGQKRKEWKVTFKDIDAKNKSKETLYMFFTLSGNFIGANFTGK